MQKAERLKQAYEHLKSLGIVHKQKDVAIGMGGIAESNISNAFKGNPRYLTDRFLKRFNQSFGEIFNNEWLMTGEGNMLKEPIQKGNAVTIIGNAASSIGSTIGMNLGSSIGTAISSGAVCASTSSGLGGIFGTLFGSLFGSKDDITEEEAADILKEALDDLKRISAENEELKNEVEYWRTKANNLEYQLSKTKAG